MKITVEPDNRYNSFYKEFLYFITPTIEELQDIGDYYWSNDYYPTYSELMELQRSYRYILENKLDKKLKEFIDNSIKKYVQNNSRD